MYRQVYTPSTMSVLDLWRPARVGDGGATAAGLRTSGGNAGFRAAPAREGKGLVHPWYTLQTLGFPSAPADAREHKPKHRVKEFGIFYVLLKNLPSYYCSWLSWAAPTVECNSL